MCRIEQNPNGQDKNQPPTQLTVVMITLEMKSFSNPKKIAFFSTVWFIVLSIFAVIPSSTPAQDNPQGRTRLRVGVADFPPYAIKTEDGKWKGVSIDLWQAVAKELAVEYEFTEFEKSRGRYASFCNE